LYWFFCLAMPLITSFSSIEGNSLRKFPYLLPYFNCSVVATWGKWRILLIIILFLAIQWYKNQFKFHADIGRVFFKCCKNANFPVYGILFLSLSQNTFKYFRNETTYACRFSRLIFYLELVETKLAKEYRKQLKAAMGICILLNHSYMYEMIRSDSTFPGTH
jgi:hypothetical protein